MYGIGIVTKGRGLKKYLLILVRPFCCPSVRFTDTLRTRDSYDIEPRLPDGLQCIEACRRGPFGHGKTECSNWEVLAMLNERRRASTNFPQPSAVNDRGIRPT